MFDPVSLPSSIMSTSLSSKVAGTVFAAELAGVGMVLVGCREREPPEKDEVIEELGGERVEE